jgi:hypothetical protein
MIEGMAGMHIWFSYWGFVFILHLRGQGKRKQDQHFLGYSRLILHSRNLLVEVLTSQPDSLPGYFFFMS